MRSTLLIVAVIVSLSVSCTKPATEQSTAEIEKEKVNLIFDTDFGPDYDDVGAIAVMHALADSGEVNILATVASTKYANVAAALNVFNTYFKRPELPIGVPKENGLTDRDFQGWSDSVTTNYPHAMKSNDEAEDAVVLYRKLLSSQPDTSVTIVTVGFLTNMADLLHSSADEYSDLSGVELVKKKVKRLVSMAGTFPEGKEYNVHRDAKASQITFTQWPTEIILSGFEIGKKIKTGLPLIANESIRASPVKDVFQICIPMDPQDSLGRMSWDETAVLVAIRGAKPYYTLSEGKIIVADDGSNTWDVNGKGHFHLVEDWDFRKVESLTNELMMHQPK